MTNRVCIEYEWEGHFKYDEKTGAWIYDRKDDWSVNTVKGKGLIAKAKELRTDLHHIINELNATKVIDLRRTQNSESFLSWVADADKGKPLPAGRAIALCLKHFAEVIKDKSGSREYHKTYNIVSSLVATNTTVQIKGLGQGKPCWFFLHSDEGDIVSEFLAEYLLALPSVFSQKPVAKRTDLKSAAEFLKSNRIVQKVKVTFFKRGTAKLIDFSSKACITDYRKGLVCGCIPIPGKVKEKAGTEPMIVKTPEMIVTSPNVIWTLKYLSQVWQDKFAQSVLISAPPGSGKEQFSQSIPYGTGRVLPNKDVISLSLAGDALDLEERLYGKKEGKKPGKKGIIAKAQNEGSVLFLDEVHYPETHAGIRATLLRPLESGDYYPRGELTADDKPLEAKKVLFVLATSKPLIGTKNVTGLNDIPPPDFWTRMTHVVVVKHPFEGIWEGLPETIGSYFKFFWWERLEKYFSIDPETEKPLDNKSKEDSLDFIQRRAQMSKLKNDSGLNELTKLFQKELLDILSKERIQPHELSIRGFRNIVTRLFSVSAAEVTQGKVFNSRSIREDKNIRGQMASIIYEILKISRLHP